MRLCNVKPLATATVMPMIVVTTASSQRNVPFGWMMGSCIQSTSQALAKYIGFSLGMAKDSSDVLSLFYYIVPRALMLLARRAASGEVESICRRFAYGIGEKNRLPHVTQTANMANGRLRDAHMNITHLYATFIIVHLLRNMEQSHV